MKLSTGNRNTGPAHNRFVHGYSKTPTHGAWLNMKERCYREANKSFKHYGGRGIKVCERWLESFENFLADMGPKPEGMTLERLDVDGDYAPGNCIWADRTVQSRNRRYTKLTPERASAIRSDRADGLTYEALAAKHGISLSHAHRVCSMGSWT